MLIKRAFVVGAVSGAVISVCGLPFYQWQFWPIITAVAVAYIVGAASMRKAIIDGQFDLYK